MTRQRQHPLPVRHGREHVLDEVRRGSGHPTTGARGTESPGLSRKRDQPLFRAGATSYAYEAAAEQATSEELLELALNETWIAEAVLRSIARMVEQRCEMVADDAIEHRGLGLAACITMYCRR